VRYADGGGLTAEGRARREKVRLQAAEMFAQDADPVQIARSLRVSTKSVYQWRRAWRSGGQESLASRGPGGSACRLDEGQLEQLRAALGMRRLEAVERRRRAIELHCQGVSQATIARRLGVSRQYVNRLVDSADVVSRHELVQKT